MTDKKAAALADTRAARKTDLEGRGGQKNYSTRFPPLQDIAIRRQAELSQLIAGAAIIDPCGVLPLLARINAEDLQDLRARRLIAELQALSQPIQEAGSDEDRADLVARAALRSGQGSAACHFAGLAAYQPLGAANLAREAVREIMELIVTRVTVKRLASYAAEIMENGYDPRR